MQTTPKSLRLQLGLFGRTNVGKSSFLNMIAGQDIAITSAVAGTTTDVVEKPMELLPIGPVVFLDTAGLDDETKLGRERIKKTEKVFDRADIVVILISGENWGKTEDEIVAKAQNYNTPILVVINKIDISPVSAEFVRNLEQNATVISASSIDHENRENYVNSFKSAIIKNCPEDFIKPPPLVGDLLPAGGLAMLIVPIDLQAPKGRLILPQVQTIRDALDNDASCWVVKEREYIDALNKLKDAPNLAICDSQVVLKMVADTPENVPCTTFSILMSRLKGDLPLMAKGAQAIDSLKDGDKVLIAESCSHHADADDIGRVKIPRWIRQYTGADLTFEVFAGRDYPENLSEYKLVLHCGSCMHNRREMLSRIQKAQEAGVPITNYGIAISKVQGVLERVLTPFPAALQAYNNETKTEDKPSFSFNL